MPATKRYPEQLHALVPEGTYARLQAVVAPPESIADFLRSAVEAALRRAERRAGSKP